MRNLLWRDQVHWQVEKMAKDSTTDTTKMARRSLTHILHTKRIMITLTPAITSARENHSAQVLHLYPELVIATGIPQISYSTHLPFLPTSYGGQIQHNSNSHTNKCKL